MYCLAECHLSSIQKAIQSAHAIVEYSSQYGDTEEYKQWAKKDKTIIILNGGALPEMQSVDGFLLQNNIKYATFAEPDMGHMLTSICFLADERVWDYDKFGHSYAEYNFRTTADKMLPKLTPDEWTEWIGGEINKLKKDIVSSLKIAL